MQEHPVDHVKISHSDPSSSSFQVSLNAPTTVSSSTGSKPVTYLKFGKLYGMTIIDAAGHATAPCKPHYRTTLKVLSNLDEAKPQARCTLSLPRRPAAEKSIAKGRHLPRIVLAPSSESYGCSSSYTQLPATNELADGLSVEWSTNEITRGSYCLLHVRFLNAPSFESSPEGLLVSISARTERVASSNTLTPSDADSEVCYADVRLFGGDDAETKLWHDVGNVHRDIEGLESMMRQTTLDTNNLRGDQFMSSILGDGSDVVAETVLDPSMQIAFENTISGKSQEIEGIQERLAELWALLASMQPVTTFGQHVKDSVAREDVHQSRKGKYGIKDHHSSNGPKRKPKVHQAVMPSRKAALNAAWTPMQEATSPQAIPARPNVKEGLCFYVRDGHDNHKYHRAIYLRERSVSALVHRILQKFCGGRGSIAVLSFTDSSGVQVMVDDEVMLHLPDGKDLVAEFVQPELPEGTVHNPRVKHTRLSSATPEQAWSSRSLQQNSQRSSVSTAAGVRSGSSIAATDASGSTTQTSVNTEYALSNGLFKKTTNAAWSGSIVASPATSATTPVEDPWLSFTNMSQWTPPDGSAFETSLMVSVEDPEVAIAPPESITLRQQFETAGSPTTSILRNPAPSVTIAPKARKKRAPRPPRGLSQEDEEDTKRESLLEKNRVAASKCRAKRKVRESDLRDEIHDKRQENDHLRSMLSELQAQARVLNEMLSGHKSCVNHAA